MYYSIHHRTHFRYSKPIRESQMELRMHPRSDSRSRFSWFDLQVAPQPRLGTYNDCWGNRVHFFDVPGLHEELEIETHVLVEVGEPPPDSGVLPTWQELDTHVEENDIWEFLLPSKFARSTELLRALMEEWKVERRDDPKTLLEELQSQIYNNFEYLPRSTRADSPIDEALDARSGVCQDFTHIFIALARELGVPCRYVSGYLYHLQEDRSVSNATHAWAEAWLPGLSWIGFDPTNNQIAGPRHIRTAIGRDYADVPPTRGVYKGRAKTELTVEVTVEQLAALPSEVQGGGAEGAAQTVNSGASISDRRTAAGALSAVWPPVNMVSVDDVTEQAQQQQQEPR